MGRKKKEIKLKEPVRIREKNLLDGSISLYLDIYYRGKPKERGSETLFSAGNQCHNQVAEC